MNHICFEFPPDDSDAAGQGAPALPYAALAPLGWGADFEKAFHALAAEGEIPARIIAVHRGRYRASISSEGSLAEIEASPAGRLSWEAGSASGLPAVGDWVLLRPSEGGPAFVTAILPRRSAFARRAPGKAVEAQVLAANVDSAFILCAAGRDWNPRRIERYLALAWEASVNPVIVVTKADMVEDAGALLAEAEAVSLGGPCFAVSALHGDGLEALSKHLEPGRTVVLLGSSGAGKSTLLNALAGRELAATKEVREDDERGRHTTTHRELFALPSGALVIDTPGLREVQLWVGEEAIESSFSDIETLAAACRFRDCSHGAEPGCAVREALESGRLDGARHASWRKLGREVAFLERRDDLNLARANADRWRAINKSMRGYSKERRSLQGKSR